MRPYIAAVLAALLFAAPARAATCFDGQLPAAPWAARAAAAAVRLIAATPDGHTFAAASGVVVAGSAAAPGGHNRILTAAHVARIVQDYPGGWLAVYGSDGRYLGRAVPAARAAPGPAFGLQGEPNVVGLRFGDEAVLEMTAFAPGAEAAYAAIAGLPLAPMQPRALLAGRFTIPAGIDRGVSGAGVVAGGAIVGVMAFRALDPGMALVPVAAGDAASLAPAPRRTVRLPRVADGFAQPVIDPPVLAALGPAGRAVGPRRVLLPQGVFVPGFVRDACIAFRATMRPA